MSPSMSDRLLLGNAHTNSYSPSSSSLPPDKLTLKNTYRNPNPLSAHIIIGDPPSAVFVRERPLPPLPGSLDKLTLLSTRAHSNMSLLPPPLLLAPPFSLSRQINMGGQTPLSSFSPLCSNWLYESLRIIETPSLFTFFLLNHLFVFLSFGQISTHPSFSSSPDKLTTITTCTVRPLTLS